MIGVVIFGLIMMCVGAGIAFAASIVKINFLERKLKHLDMATGYAGRNEVQNKKVIWKVEGSVPASFVRGV